MNQGPSQVPHRKNAAEWAMWIALQPVRWFMAFASRLNGRRPM